jgi:hypothetical protein
MNIKEPTFDKPSDLGTVRERVMVDPYTVPVEVGSRVVLIYQGREMTAHVTAVEVAGSRFLGRVDVFDGAGLEHGDLKHEDIFRFHHHDLRWIG